jgi:hypothetical protein
MYQKITYTWLADKCICILLVLSMFSVVRTEVAGFPVYSLLLLTVVSVWMLGKILYAGREGQPFLMVRYRTDTAAFAAILYAVISAVIKLFSNPDDGWIDFSWNAEVIALAVLCLLVSAETQFRALYLDLLLYSGLLTAGVYMLLNLTDGLETDWLLAAFSDSGQTASYFMLVGMVSVYACCTGKDKMRSVFYMMTAGVSFMALFVNQSSISLWLMAFYFLALPVVLRPTALLVKRVMQLFFMYLFMLSNMSLLTEYTDIFRKEIFYSLQHSVYVDLLLAAGGAVFFCYWERIPAGTALERLVLRKLQKGYRMLVKVIALLFVVTAAAGGRMELPGKAVGDMFRTFVLPLSEEMGGRESGLWCVFQGYGVIPGLFLIIMIVLFADRMYRNHAEDKTVTGALSLISGIFVVQLLFWNPGLHNIVCYFYLILTASLYKEERKQVKSVGISAADLELKIQEIQV